MSKKKLFADKDSEQTASFKNSEQFARLMSPSGKKPAKPAPCTKSGAPDIQTRANYTGKDLEKFEKMFSAEFVPKTSPASDQKTVAVTKSASATENKIKTENTDHYQASDQDQFDKLIATKPVKKRVLKAAPGGKIENSKPRSLYNQADQAQFDQIIGSSLRAQKPQRSEEVETGVSERKRGFPGFHQNSISQLSSSSSELGSRRLKVKRPGIGRIQLKYFD